MLERIKIDIGLNPKRYPITMERDDLRVVTRPKPFDKRYRVFYHFDGKQLYIVSVFNNSQNPDIWQSR